LILNSRTSGVDGSSEGGRINTENIVNVLALFGTALMDEFRARGYSGKSRVGPEYREGRWVLVATFPDSPPAGLVPARWHGRRVLVEKEPPPPAPQ